MSSLKTCHKCHVGFFSNSTTVYLPVGVGGLPVPFCVACTPVAGALARHMQGMNRAELRAYDRRLSRRSGRKS